MTQKRRGKESPPDRLQDGGKVPQEIAADGGKVPVKPQSASTRREKFLSALQAANRNYGDVLRKLAE